MQVAVLVIVYRGEDRITLHDTEACAWSELLRFVDDRQDGDTARAYRTKPKTEDDLVQEFFAAEGDSYIIGNANLSEAEAHVEAKLCDEYMRGEHPSAPPIGTLR